MPLRLAITDHPSDEESNTLVYQGAPWSVRLAAKLLRMRRAGVASPWHAYLQVGRMGSYLRLGGWRRGLHACNVHSCIENNCRTTGWSSRDAVIVLLSGKRCRLCYPQAGPQATRPGCAVVATGPALLLHGHNVPAGVAGAT